MMEKRASPCKQDSVFQAMLKIDSSPGTDISTRSWHAKKAGGRFYCHYGGKQKTGILRGAHEYGERYQQPQEASQSTEQQPSVPPCSPTSKISTSFSETP